MKLNYIETVSDPRERIRVAKSRSSLFDCIDFVFEVEEGYKRDMLGIGYEVESYVKNDQIMKYFGVTGYLPAYTCHGGTFIFTKGCIERDVDLIKKELGKYIQVAWESNRILKLRIKEPSQYLIEFDFLLHSMGLYISVFTLV